MNYPRLNSKQILSWLHQINVRIQIEIPVTSVETEQFASAIVLVLPSAGLMKTSLLISETSRSARSRIIMHRLYQIVFVMSVQQSEVV